MEVRVNERYTFKVADSEEEMKRLTVLQLKEKIHPQLSHYQQRSHYPGIVNMSVIYAGKQLSDEDTLHSSRIEHLSAIFIRPVGGLLLGGSSTNEHQSTYESPQQPPKRRRSMIESFNMAGETPDTDPPLPQDEGSGTCSQEKASGSPSEGEVGEKYAKCVVA